MIVLIRIFFTENRFILSARLQTVLKTIFQDILQETLSDAKKIAEQAGKGRVSLKDVETALQKLCSRFYPTSIKIQEKHVWKQIKKEFLSKKHLKIQKYGKFVQKWKIVKVTFKKL